MRNRICDGTVHTTNASVQNPVVRCGIHSERISIRQGVVLNSMVQSVIQVPGANEILVKWCIQLIAYYGIPINSVGKPFYGISMITLREIHRGYYG